MRDNAFWLCGRTIWRNLAPFIFVPLCTLLSKRLCRSFDPQLYLGNMHLGINLSHIYSGHQSTELFIILAKLRESLSKFSANHPKIALWRNISDRHSQNMAVICLHYSVLDFCISQFEHESVVFCRWRGQPFVSGWWLRVLAVLKLLLLQEKAFGMCKWRKSCWYLLPPLN